jgi:hypothetical protein
MKRGGEAGRRGSSLAAVDAQGGEPWASRVKAAPAIDAYSYLDLSLALPARQPQWLSSGT